MLALVEIVQQVRLVELACARRSLGHNRQKTNVLLRSMAIRSEALAFLARLRDDRIVAP